MAKADPLKTAFTACILGLPVFIVPYLFVYNTSFLLQGDVDNIIYQLAICTFGFVIFASGYIGYFTIKLIALERLLLITGAACLIHLGLITDAIGFAIIAIALFSHYLRKRRNESIKE
jgi:TRAP-type uncharacterized transport system fused permease subunit